MSKENNSERLDKEIDNISTESLINPFDQGIIDYGKGQAFSSSLYKLQCTHKYIQEAYGLSDSDIINFSVGNIIEEKQAVYAEIMEDMETKITERYNHALDEKIGELIQKNKHINNKEFFKLVRSRFNLTQKQMSERFHISITSVRNWEQGVQFPNSSTLVLILLALPDSAKAVANLPKIVSRQMTNETNLEMIDELLKFTQAK